MKRLFIGGSVGATLVMAPVITVMFFTTILQGAGGNGSDSSVSGCDASVVATSNDIPATQLKPDQVENGLKIIAIGRQRKRDDRDVMSAIMAALTESKMRNLKFGDRDSLGLFQMRPSQGWGTPQQILNTTYSINKYYAVLEKVSSRSGLSLGQMSQAVERSGFPDRYAAYESTASALLSSKGGQQAVLAGSSDCGLTASYKAQQALSFAVAQIGTPYLWGGTGLSSQGGQYDCSGLVQAAYQTAGIAIERNTQMQYEQALGKNQVFNDLNKLKPGDLVFFGTINDIGHVGMFLSKDSNGDYWMVDAPKTNEFVRKEVFANSSNPNSSWRDFFGAARVV